MDRSWTDWGLVFPLVTALERPTVRPSYFAAIPHSLGWLALVEVHVWKPDYAAGWSCISKHYGVTADPPNATINSRGRGGHSDE
jgi:hypothetical protein